MCLFLTIEFTKPIVPAEGDLGTRNDDLEDPKGDNEGSPGDSNNRLEAWDHVFCAHDEIVETMTPHFIDMDPTNGQSGNHSVTYFIRIRMESPEPTDINAKVHIGSSYLSNDENRSSVPTILSVFQI